MYLKAVQPLFGYRIDLCRLTGRRRFPEEVPCTSDAPCPEERAEPFEMKTTEQAYAEFPSAVRASFPLYVRNAGPQARGLPCSYAHTTPGADCPVATCGVSFGLLA